MYAEDGIHWELPEHSLFMNKEIILKNGERLEVDRLERPQLLLDEMMNRLCFIQLVPLLH